MWLELVSQTYGCALSFGWGSRAASPLPLTPWIKQRAWSLRAPGIPAISLCTGTLTPSASPVGVNTSDIITLYISAIKALRELDPSMVILEVACEPIRKYLR